MTTEDDFQRALDANPDDHATRLVFADWLQVRDDPRAEGYRALGVRRRQPQRRGRKGDSRWFWAWVAAHNWHRPEYRAYPDCFPRDWWDALERDRRPLRGYTTRREAEDAAALAFAKLPPERRAELHEPRAER